MDIIFRLRIVEPDKEGERTRWYRNPDGPEAAKEIERLRQKNEELLVEMERIADVSERWEDCLVSQINEIARAAITKATGAN